MKIETKEKLASLSIWIILITVVVIVLFFFGFLVSNTFDLKVFNNRTSDFVVTLFGTSLVIVICGAFLNISLNIGIIADSKLEKVKASANRSFIKRTLIITLSVIIVITAFLFTGDYLTRKSEKNKLVSECQDIVKRYDNSIQEISKALSDNSKIKEIPDILKFLENQKDEFPSIILITSTEYQGQLTFLKITNWSDKKDLTKELFNFSFYSCNTDDCEYLKRIFSTKDSDYYFWSKKDEYKLYYPIDNGNKKFVLLFSQFDRYGKIGS
jgi:hypothetical protein